MTTDITVVIPSIPPREKLLERALQSVDDQIFPVSSVVVEYDRKKEGAAITRQRGLDRVDTEWVAFLDDDDEFLPEHLQILMTCALEESADYVYSWYHVIGGKDPRPELFGKPFDPKNPIQTTITTLVRTELAQATGFLAEEAENLSSPDRLYAGEDWRLTKRCVDAGAHIVHAPYRSWRWYHHGKNTSGLPKNW